MPAWDNTARRANAATIYHGAKPEIYEQWLTAILNKARSAPEGSGRFVFINAWNEWAEGAHLEPDQRNGFQFLEATRRAALNTRFSQNEKLQPQHAAFTEASGAREADTAYPIPKKLPLPLLIIGHDAAAAGSQLVLLEFLRELQKRSQYRAHLVLQANGALTEEYKRVADTIILEGEPTSGSVAQRQLQQAIRSLREAGLRHALCNTVVTSYAAEVCHKEGLSVISLIHEQPESIDTLFGGSPTIDRINQSAEHIVSVSQYSRTALEQQYGPILPQHSVIHPPARKFATDEHDYESARNQILPDVIDQKRLQIVLGCGTLYPRKGPDLFIQLAQSVVRTQSQSAFRFIWVGGALSHDGVLQHQQAATDAGVGDLVHFVGVQEDMAIFFEAADIFALTSREDPFPLVNMEAMSFGLPVIAFEGAGGAPELIGKDAGIVVPYLDIEAMAKAITDLAADPGRRKEMGERARTKVDESFSAANYADQILRIVE